MEFKEIGKFEHNEEDNLQSEILDLLDKYDIKLDPDRKDQHILISRETINQLVNSAELTPDDVILEIGPGPGQITEVIAQNAGKVYAIEVDERFRPVLDDLQKKYGNLEVIFGSALDVK
jgi:16S rRNA (adenine1518-N6/adenine1519-N6)-dimethyltransferase